MMVLDIIAASQEADAHDDPAEKCKVFGTPRPESSVDHIAQITSKGPGEYVQKAAGRVE
jgi:hypothetical protein